LTTERKIQLAFVLALLLTCAVGAMSYFSLLRLREDVAWVVHTQRVITALESLFSSMTDAVAAQRGYAIAGSGNFIDSYRLAIRGVHEDVETLRQLLADNPPQQERLADLVRLVDDREKFSYGVTELRRHGRIAEAQALISKGRGNEIHEQIRILVDRMQNDERVLLDQREARAAHASLVARSIIVLGGIMALIIAAAALVLIARDFSGRRKAEAALRGMVNALEDRVRERTVELGEANRTVGASEARLQGILQSAMDAVIAVDDRQAIVLFNAAAETIFQCRAGEALGQPLDRFIPERFRAAHRGHVERFGETGTTTRVMGARLELFGLRGSGEEFPIDASISQVSIEGRKFFTVILRDVTQRKKAENELRQANFEWRSAHEQLTAIIQSAMDAVITIDKDQRILLFNQAAEKMFRCGSQDAVGSPLDRFIPERFRGPHRGHVERFGETRVTTRMMGGQLSLSGLRADGEEFPIDASISQATIDGKKLYTVILRDITERKRAQDELERSHRELRELAAAMHEVREAERTRVARELHDELAQWLTAIKMDVSWLSARLPREQLHLLEKTEKVKGLVDTTVAAVRRIASDLRPVMLDDLGLLPAIESLLHDLSQRTGVVVTLDAGTDDLDFHEPLATSVFRMIQEALTNVARHSGATEVAVLIRRSDDNLVVRVVDNGRGFDPESAARRKSYGVLGIQERAYTLGGKATIVRGAVGGTVVEITVPTTRYRKQEGNDDSRAAG
jgi:PAS domain S-box-containing protein